MIQGVGLVSVGRTLKAARLARDLYHRAIDVMRGASALGGFVSLTDEESFAVEYWPLELYKLSLAPPPRELQGTVALITGAAGGIGSAVARALAAEGACVVATDIDEEGARRGRGRARRRRGRACGPDVTDEASVADAYRAAVLAFGGVDIVVSNAGIASSAPIEETTLELVGPQQRHPRPRLLPRRARGGARAARAGHRRQHRLHRLEERARAGQERRRLLGGEGRVELHLARCLAEELGAGRDPRQHRQPRRRARGLADLGLGVARGARARLRHRAGRARGALPRADDAEGERLPDDVAEAVLFFASPTRARARAPATSSTSTAAWRSRTRG